MHLAVYTCTHVCVQLDLRELTALIEEGKVKPHVEAVMALEKVGEKIRGSM